MDRIAPLLHRITGAPYAELNYAIAQIPSDHLARLDALAGEIIDDARAISLAETAWSVNRRHAGLAPVADTRAVSGVVAQPWRSGGCRGG